MLRRLTRAAFVSSAAWMLVVACGGQAEQAKSPTDEAPAAPAASTDEPTATPEGSESTTTLNVPDGGDLQGMKLETSTHKVVEVKGDGGAKPGPHAPEPGRRREDVQAIVQAHRDEARACYDKGLKDHPEIAGKIDVKWTVDPSGNVTDAEIDKAASDILEPSVGQCVVDVIKKLKFNASEKGFETRMHYPFDFHPRGPVRPAAK